MSRILWCFCFWCVCLFILFYFLLRTCFLVCMMMMTVMMIVAMSHSGELEGNLEENRSLYLTLAARKAPLIASLLLPPQPLSHTVCMAPTYLAGRPRAWALYRQHQPASPGQRWKLEPLGLLSQSPRSLGDLCACWSLRSTTWNSPKALIFSVYFLFLHGHVALLIAAFLWFSSCQKEVKVLISLSQDYESSVWVCQRKHSLFDILKLLKYLLFI